MSQVALTPIFVSIGNLLLDPNNYRLTPTQLEVVPDDLIASRQDACLAELLQNHNVAELERSIIEHGWLDVDQIVVRRLFHPRIDDVERFVVVEGNRRVAALLDLASDARRRSAETMMHPSIQEALSSLRVLLIEGSKEQVNRTADAIMGMRHVVGPRRWGGLEAARLVVNLVDRDGLPMNKAAEVLIISTIEARRRYRSYKAYIQALDLGFSQENLFTLLGEAIRVSAIREWLGWSDTAEGFQNSSNLEIVYGLLGKEVSPAVSGSITNPQEMRDIRAVLENDSARDALERSRSLSDAWRVVERESDDRMSVVRRLLHDLEILLSGLTEPLPPDVLANISRLCSLRKSEDVG